MHIIRTPWLRLIGLSLLLLATSACYQAMGDDIQATDAAQQAPTFTPVPSNTPFPTTTPVATNTLAPTPPSSNPNINIDIGVTLDASALLTPGANIGAVAQVPTMDPIYQTVTAIYAAQQGQPVATQDITQLEPMALTATYIVGRATQTAGAPLTQQAIALGTVFATQAAPGATQQPAAGVTIIPGNDCVHEVRATDRNLYRIALNYGLTVQQIAQYNNLVNPDLIFVGQQLTIPGCGVTGAVPLPTSSPTPGGAAQTVPTPLLGTPVPGVTFTPVPVGQSAGPQVHVVRQGETLFEISLQYGVTVHEIAAVNGISNINLVYIGQELTIP